MNINVALNKIINKLLEAMTEYFGSPKRSLLLSKLQSSTDFEPI